MTFYPTDTCLRNYPPLVIFYSLCFASLCFMAWFLILLSFFIWSFTIRCFVCLSVCLWQKTLGDVARHRMLSYDVGRLHLITPMDLWRNSTPFLGVEAFCMTKIGVVFSPTVFVLYVSVLCALCNRIVIFFMIFILWFYLYTLIVFALVHYTLVL